MCKSESLSTTCKGNDTQCVADKASSVAVHDDGMPITAVFPQSITIELKDEVAERLAHEV